MVYLSRNIYSIDIFSTSKVNLFWLTWSETLFVYIYCSGKYLTRPAIFYLTDHIKNRILLHHLGWNRLILYFRPWLTSNIFYAALWPIKYFQPDTDFPWNETSQTSRHSIAISLGRFLMSSIPLFHHFRPLQLKDTMLCIEDQILVVPFVFHL